MGRRRAPGPALPLPLLAVLMRSADGLVVRDACVGTGTGGGEFCPSVSCRSYAPLSRGRAMIPRPSWSGTALFDRFGEDGSSRVASSASASVEMSISSDAIRAFRAARPFKGFGAPPPPCPVVPANGTKDPEEEGEDGQPRREDPAPTAPEVNQWTTLMADGMNADIPRPGREDMTAQEAMLALYDDLKDMNEEDDCEVAGYWNQIEPTVRYLNSTDQCRVREALQVAYRAHRGQRRKSGEPFIIHPVQVSLLLSGLRMDAETVMSGLLHDTVEDTDLTFCQVDAMFGHDVRSIVEGETKVSKLPKLAISGDRADEQAENLRQMFVAMTDDYRIIVVKLADRLHNMRTLRHMKPEKQVKISRETLDIFAPLAHRMGIWQFKSELEDTAFMYLYPKEYKELNRLLRRHQKRFRETLDKSQSILKATLDSDPTLRDQTTRVQVMGRTKELYSLWRKMEAKGAEHDLDCISDAVALRVVFTPRAPKEDKRKVNGDKTSADKGNNAADRGVWLCYHVLGLVQHLPGFQPLPTKVS